MPFIAILALTATAVGWIWGEVRNKRLLRIICGPTFTLLVGIMASIVVGVHTSFDSSLIYSGAIKDFTSALVAAIDRGDIDAAHQELRRFNDESIQTYEGGALLKWLREPVKRLEAK